MVLVIPEPLLYVFTALDGARELLADLPDDDFTVFDGPEKTVDARSELQRIGDLDRDMHPSGFVIVDGFSYPQLRSPSCMILWRR